jgi:hypothetical protein
MDLERFTPKYATPAMLEACSTVSFKAEQQVVLDVSKWLSRQVSAMIYTTIWPWTTLSLAISSVPFDMRTRRTW